MIKYTVMLTKARITYERAEIEVEAEDETMAYAVATETNAFGGLNWQRDEPHQFDDGWIDVEVTNADGGNWDRRVLLA